MYIFRIIFIRKGAMFVRNRYIWQGGTGNARLRGLYWTGETRTSQVRCMNKYKKGHRICDGPIIPIFESLLPEEVISDLCIISE